jgi:hypothetical protein
VCNDPAGARMLLDAWRPQANPDLERRLARMRAG